MKWDVLPLGELAASTDGAISIGPFGSAMKADTYTEVGIPVVRGTNISDTRAWKGDWVYIPEDLADRMKRCLVFAGDLVLPHRGSIGEVAIIPDDEQGRYFISSSLMKITLDRGKIEPVFCYYFLRSAEGRSEILRFSSSVGTPGIGQPLTSLRQFKIPVPPLPEQRAIAATLGALDDKIELNRKMNATLEAMARALFRDWFVTFGPTRAKMAQSASGAKNANDSRAPTLSPDLWSLFPDRLDDEGKPEGWEEKPLDEIADFLNGLALQKFPGEGEADSLPVIKIAELRNGITANSNRASRNLPPRYIVQDGDFLFSWSGSLLAKFWTGGEGALNQHLFKVTSGRYPAWFYSEWVQHHLEYFQVIAASKATTMGHIQRGHLKAAKTICPPDSAIVRLGEIVAPLIDRIIRNELESRTLAQTRDLLLPRLMSGALRVAEAERLASEGT